MKHSIKILYEITLFNRWSFSSLVHLLIHTFVHLFICSFIQPVIRSLIYSFISSLNRRFYESP